MRSEPVVCRTIEGCEEGVDGEEVRNEVERGCCLATGLASRFDVVVIRWERCSGRHVDCKKERCGALVFCGVGLSRVWYILSLLELHLSHRGELFSGFIFRAIRRHNLCTFALTQTHTHIQLSTLASRILNLAPSPPHQHSITTGARRHRDKYCSAWRSDKRLHAPLPSTSPHMAQSSIGSSTLTISPPLSPPPGSPHLHQHKPHPYSNPQSPSLPAAGHPPNTHSDDKRNLSKKLFSPTNSLPSPTARKARASNNVCTV